jgi:hypothetical protein
MATPELLSDGRLPLVECRSIDEPAGGMAYWISHREVSGVFTATPAGIVIPFDRNYRRTV